MNTPNIFATNQFELAKLFDEQKKARKLAKNRAEKARAKAIKLASIKK
jgi:hypothetical protein